jgi:anti-anti-sigma factor
MTTLSLLAPCAEVRVAISAAEVRIVFVGELDLSLAEQFASLRTLVNAERLPVAVDLSGVTFFGAWAANALVELRAAAPAGSFTVQATSEPVRVTLDACGLTFDARTHAMDV